MNTDTSTCGMWMWGMAVMPPVATMMPPTSTASATAGAATATSGERTLSTAAVAASPTESRSGISPTFSESGMRSASSSEVSICRPS